MDFSRLLEALKGATFVFLAALCASGLLLFRPEAFGVTMSAEQRFAVVCTFLLSGFLLVSQAGAWAVRGVRKAQAKSNAKGERAQRLKELSPPERAILKLYVDNGTTTRSFSMTDGVVRGLVAKRILYQASNIPKGLQMNLEYNLQEWAWRLLAEHPTLLEGASLSHWTGLPGDGMPGDQ